MQFFPLLMSIGRLAFVIWNKWISQQIGKVIASLKLKKEKNDLDELATAKEKEEIKAIDIILL